MALPAKRSEPVAAAARPRAVPAAKPAVEAAEPAEGGPVLRWIQGPAPVTAPATKPARTSVSVGTEPDTTSAVQLVRTKTFRIDEASETVTQERASPRRSRRWWRHLRRRRPRLPMRRPPATAIRTGWIIQIGATDSETAARKLLDKARSSAQRVLSSAEPFTETVDKNGSRLWRARFAGFDDQKRGAGGLRRAEVPGLRLHGRPPLREVPNVA